MCHAVLYSFERIALHQGWNQIGSICLSPGQIGHFFSGSCGSLDQTIDFIRVGSARGLATTCVSHLLTLLSLLQSTTCGTLQQVYTERSDGRHCKNPCCTSKLFPSGKIQFYFTIIILIMHAVHDLQTHVYSWCYFTLVHYK